MTSHILKRVGLVGLVVLCVFLLQHPPAYAAGSVMIDNYNDGNMGSNTFGFWTGWGGGTSIQEEDVYPFDGDKEGIIYYNGSGWYASNLWNNSYFLDFTDAEALSFNIKGQQGGEDFYIQLQYDEPINGGPQPLIEIHYPDDLEGTPHYLPITQEWQQVEIPLSYFAGVDKTKLRSLCFRFDYRLSMPNGMLYLDGLSFTYSEAMPLLGGMGPNILMVDNYNDGNPNLNSLNYWTGGNPDVNNFIMEEIILYDYNESQWPYVDEINRARRFEINSTQGLWYASNLWDGSHPDTLGDVTEFEYLSFRIKGGREGGNFRIEVQYGRPRHEDSAEINSLDHFAVTSKWQQINIPLSKFIGLERSEVRAVAFLFDSQGTIYIDNLEFSKGHGKPKSTGPVRIDRETGMLYVNNQPFYIKGVGYQPVPIGGMPPHPDDVNLYIRDFPLLKQMGCNTIRTWGEPGPILMQKAEEEGLKVIAGFWMDANLDYANPDTCLNTKLNFQAFVDTFKDSPALLVWAIGNECNYNSNISNPHYYSLANELAEAAYLIEGFSYHPVIVVNGKLFNIGKDEEGAEDMQLNYLDAWGANIYAQQYSNVDWFSEPRSVFEVYNAKSAKPLIITEYGADAFHTDLQHPGDPNYNYEDEDAQADWVRQNTLDIKATSDVCLGGCLMAYSDEWWKYVDPNNHDLGPADYWGPHLLPDGYANEEYWGIVSISPDGPDKDVVDDVTPRQVYYTLKDIFTRSQRRNAIKPTYTPGV